ncbi:MAG: fatty acid desaturase [Chromatiales bacterium]|nr:fatty acid desaturase [Gammaproteobacteria bacterium]MBW6475794.1 fatty acid desaturase [Chromatiales bacterium]
MQLHGLFSFSWWEVVLYALLLTHITIASVTIFLHRHQAHRALELHPVVSHFFRFWLWLSTGMVTREWVSIHRKHHSHCETEQDPHSPQVKGIKTVFWRGAELYRDEALNAETLEKFGKGTPNDWLERKIYSPYPYLGISLMMIINLLVFGPIGLTVWAVQMIWIPLFAAGVINGLGHYVGYRNAESPDASTNLVPWGILIGGEELHNNHHAWPGSAKLSFQPWEFDIGWFYIRILERLGLARVKRVSPSPARLKARAQGLEPEAMHAIIQSRMQVLGRYGRDVISRVYREERRRLADNPVLSRLLKQVKLALLRDQAQLDESSRQQLGGVLKESQALHLAMEFRERLLQIWQQAGAGQEEALRALQAWCAEAEASGNRYLQAFARQLGGYRLAGA